MRQLSILDKLKVLFDLTMNNKWFILIIALLILISIVFITTSRKNIKKNRKIVISTYILVILAIIIIFNKSILSMYDSMMNDLFIIFYFPNISVYVAAIIATNIIVLTSVFSKKTSKINKVINSIVFFLLHYILVLILNVISTNNLNVFNQQALYKNTDIHSLVELSSNIFIVWIIYLVIYKIINNYLISKKSTVVVEKVIEVTKKETNTSKKYKVPKYIKVLKNPIKLKQGSRFGDNVRIIDAPLTVKNIKTVKEEFMENVKSIKSPIIIKRRQPVTSYDLFKEEFMSNIKSIKAPVLIKRDYSFGGIRAINSPVTIKNEGSIKTKFIDNIKSIEAPTIIKRNYSFGDIRFIDYPKTIKQNKIKTSLFDKISDIKEEKKSVHESISSINNINIRPVFNNITKHHKAQLNTNTNFDINLLEENNYLTLLKVLNKYKISKKEQALIEKQHRVKLSEFMDLCGNN